MSIFARVIHPNRWFFWALSLIFITFILAWGASERHRIEVDKIDTELNSQYIPIPLHKKSTDTSGWKTYHNEKYGFEFKHPQNLNNIFVGNGKSYPAPNSDVMIFINKESEEIFMQGNYFERGTRQELINGKLVNRSVQTDTACFFANNQSYCFDILSDFNTTTKVLSTLNFFEPQN